MTALVILNYINWNATAACVKSAIKSDSNIHIYLVDNNSPVKMPGVTRRLLSDCEKKGILTFIKNKKNLGYAAGNNVGIRAALKDNCDYLMIVNSDIIFTKNTVKSLRDYLEKNKTVGIAGPMILDTDGKITKNCITRKTGLREKYLVRTRLNRIFKKEYLTYFAFDKDYRKSFKAYSVHGSCFMVSRECLEKVFPFDENTFLYEEELILGIRMEEAGFETVYYPKAKVYHYGAGSTRCVKKFSYLCEIKSEIYFCKKYLGAKSWQIFPLVLYRIIKYILKVLTKFSF